MRTYACHNLLSRKIVRDLLSRVEEFCSDLDEAKLAAKPLVTDRARLDVEQFSRLAHGQQFGQFKPLKRALDLVLAVALALRSLQHDKERVEAPACCEECDVGQQPSHQRSTKAGKEKTLAVWMRSSLFLSRIPIDHLL